MADWKVGGAYVELSLQGLDKVLNGLEEASKAFKAYYDNIQKMSGSMSKDVFASYEKELKSIDKMLNDYAAQVKSLSENLKSLGNTKIGEDIGVSKVAPQINEANTYITEFIGKIKTANTELGTVKSTGGTLNLKAPLSDAGEALKEYSEELKRVKELQKESGNANAIKKYNEEINEACAKLKEYGLQLKAITTERKGLEASMSKSGTAVDKYNQMLEKEVDIFAKLDAEQNKTREQIEATTAKINELNAKKQETSATKTGLEESLEKSNKELDESVVKWNNIKGVVADVYTEYKRVYDLQEHMAKREEALNNQLRVKEAALEKKTTIYGEDDKRTQNEAASIEVLKSKIEEVKQIYAEYKAEVEKVKAALDVLSTAEAQNKASVESKRASVQAIADELRTEEKSLREIEKSLKTEGDSLEKSNQSYKKRETVIKSIKEKIASLDSVIKKYNNSIKDGKTRVEEIKDKENALTKEIEKQQGVLHNIVSRFESLSGIFDGLKEKVSSTTVGLREFRTILMTIKGIIAGVAAKKLYDALITPNAQLENYVVQFNTLLGSMEKAEKITKQIEDISVVTPFQYADITEVVKSLSQFGVEQDKLIPQFKKLADLSQGNIEKLNGIADAYNKAKAAGFLTFRELRQFTNNGVPMINALADSLGKTNEEIVQMARNGEITFQRISDAIDYLTTDGGKFEGLVENMSQTLEGRFSTLKDNLKIIGRDIGTESFNMLSEAIQNIIDEINRLRDTGELETWTRTLGTEIAHVVDLMLNFGKTLYENRGLIKGFAVMLLSFIGTFKLFSSALKLIGVNALGSVPGITALTVATSLLAAEISNAVLEAQKMLEIRSFLDTKFGDSMGVNETTINSLNKAFEKTSALATKSKSLARELSELTKVESKNEEQKKRIATIVDTLNSLYPDLALKYNRLSDELNVNADSLENYISKMQAVSDLEIAQEGLKNLIDIGVDIDIERNQLTPYLDMLRELDEFIHTSTLPQDSKEFAEGIANIMGVNVSELDADKIFNIVHTISDLLAEAETRAEKLDIDKLWNTAAQKSMEDAVNNARTFIDTTDGAIQRILTTDELMEQLWSGIQEGNKIIDNLNDSSSELSTTLNDNINRFHELTEAVEKNKTAEGFSYDEMMKLVDGNLELAAAVEEVDGVYHFREGTLEDLVAKEQGYMSDAIASTAEFGNTLAALIETSTSGSYNRDAVYVTEQGDLITLTQLAEMAIAVFEALGVSIDNYKKKADLASTATKNVPRGGGGGGHVETAWEKEIRDIKWQYDMGIIEAEAYYNRLEEIYKAHYAEGSKDWQKYALEVKRGRDKIEEEKRKALEAQFEAGKEMRDNYLEDEEFYDRLTLEKKIEGLKEIREYIQKSYEDRLIDYERFTEEMRDIDKRIYESEKELIQQNIDELDEMRKKKYDRAVKQVNDFYEAVYAAQKKADREAELEELRQAEELYQGAVSRQGQEKLKQIQKDIQKLQREKLNAELEEQRMYQLENLEARYLALEESQKEYYNTIQAGVKSTAEIVEEYTRQINSFFSSISGILNTVREDAYQSVQNITVNNNNYDAAAARASYDMTKIISNYGFK